MGYIITVALVVVIIGYLLGKDDIGAIRSPDLFSHDPVNTAKDEINQADVIPQKPSSSALFYLQSPTAQWKNPAAWQNSDLSNHDDWFDPTNPLSPFNPLDSDSSSSFEDNMFTDSFSCNDFNAPFNND
jgi:hypothetical protein